MPSSELVCRANATVLFTLVIWCWLACQASMALAAQSTNATGSSTLATNTNTPANRNELAEGEEFRLGNSSYIVRYLAAQVWDREARDRLVLWHAGEGWVIDRARPTLKSHFVSLWSTYAVSGDLSRAVVVAGMEYSARVGGRGGFLGVADLKTQELLVTSSGYGFEATRWQFSRDQRYAVPLRGMGLSGWGYFDLEQKKFVTVKLLDLDKETDWHYWSGTVLDDDKTCCLFVRDAVGKVCKRLTFDLEKPEKRTVVDCEFEVSGFLAMQDGDLFLGRARKPQVIRVSPKTWTIVSEVTNRTETLRLTGARDPSGRYIYARNEWSSAPLSIFGSQTGELAKTIDFGLVFNAKWLGVTFSTNGRFAVVAAPYGRCITVIDTSTLEVIERFNSQGPPAGVFLIGTDNQRKPGVCLIVTTFLPYE
jgi:hypothetical protein